MSKNKNDAIVAINDNELWLSLLRIKIQGFSDNHHVHDEVERLLTKVWYQLERIDSFLEKEENTP